MKKQIRAAEKSQRGGGAIPPPGSGPGHSEGLQTWSIFKSFINFSLCESALFIFYLICKRYYDILCQSASFHGPGGLSNLTCFTIMIIHRIVGKARDGNLQNRWLGTQMDSYSFGFVCGFKKPQAGYKTKGDGNQSVYNLWLFVVFLGFFWWGFQQEFQITLTKAVHRGILSLFSKTTIGCEVEDCSAQFRIKQERQK